MDQAAERLPKYADYIKAAKPYVVKAADAADAAWPHAVKAFEKCQELWKKLEPYDPEQFFPLLFGLILCFFGGSYLTLIAAVEAVRLTVWEKLSKAVKDMYQNYCVALEASQKDDMVDDNGDGVPDVQQISKKDLITRKVYVVAKAVNPEKMSEALGLLWGAVLSVIATLRIQFAQAITLGCSLGTMLHTNFDKNLQPVITQALPTELQKWAPVLSRYTFRSIGVTFAWFMQRIISGFHCAIRGGNMFVTNAVKLAKKHNYLPADFEEESPKVTAAATAVALLGFYWQFSNGFALPFPLNVLLLPVTIAEWILEYWVGL